MRSGAYQVWYTDDTLVCDTLHDLCYWFELFISQSSEYGYFPNTFKSHVIVDDSVKAEVEQIFAPLGIHVVCNRSYLGRFLGESAGRAAFAQDKVH